LGHNGRKMAWISWKKVYKLKGGGGLGVKDMEMETWVTRKEFFKGCFGINIWIIAKSGQGS